MSATGHIAFTLSVREALAEGLLPPLEITRRMSGDRTSRD